jgi:hypothetical protein
LQRTGDAFYAIAHKSGSNAAGSRPRGAGSDRVKRVLFDEDMPRQLRRDLPEFRIRTVQEAAERRESVPMA